MCMRDALEKWRGPGQSSPFWLCVWFVFFIQKWASIFEWLWVNEYNWKCTLQKRKHNGIGIIKTGLVHYIYLLLYNKANIAINIIKEFTFLYRFYINCVFSILWQNVREHFIFLSKRLSVIRLRHSIARNDQFKLDLRLLLSFRITKTHGGSLWQYRQFILQVSKDKSDWWCLRVLASLTYWYVYALPWTAKRTP